MLQEVVGEPRFGLDEELPASASTGRVWDNLSWAHFESGLSVLNTTKFPSPPIPASADGLTWGANAADMASILYQQPALVAFHAREMLKDVEP